MLISHVVLFVIQVDRCGAFHLENERIYVRIELTIANHFIGLQLKQNSSYPSIP
jgi:hypothetical protein